VEEKFHTFLTGVCTGVSCSLYTTASLLWEKIAPVPMK